MRLDISEYSSNSNKHYKLMAIIAYASLHFISFINIKDSWYVFDDENVYECSEDLLVGLFGGITNGKNEEESVKLNPLWQRTAQYKWVAKLLFYKEENYQN